MNRKVLPPLLSIVSPQVNAQDKIAQWNTLFDNLAARKNFRKMAFKMMTTAALQGNILYNNANNLYIPSEKKLVLSTRLLWENAR
jgi:hypothetical protein